MVGVIVASICMVLLLVLGLIWLNEIKKEEIKTNKKKQSMYDKWYDLGVLLADIENEKLNNKEIK